ncbi:MAG: cobyrinic acid ac-diamide synthase [uncultured bacterium]|nr:MAG: cobyrinic acid ac-diamide synthase [uncultured bacterium]
MIDSKKIRIAIASGKGGTGKTLISTNLFYVLQQINYKVTLIDCDAEEPNVMVFFNGDEEFVHDVTQKVPVIDEIKCTYCGKCQEYCSYNAIFLLKDIKTIRILEDLCHGCGACSVACEYNAVSEKNISLGVIKKYHSDLQSTIIEARMRVGVFSPVSVIKAAIKEAGDNGIILMDSPPGTSCPFIQTVSVADFVILVTEPTPFGLSDLKQSVETLKTMNKSCGVIINRADLGDNEVYSYIKHEGIPLLMEIPFDKEIASHYSKGEIVANFIPEWKSLFENMFNSIYKKYGNSNNQR